MKLYEVNQMISDIFEQLVNPETGEVILRSPRSKVNRSWQLRLPCF